MKTTLATFLATSCLFAVACGGGTDPELDAVFSDADAEHLQRVHAAATLQDAAFPIFFAFFLDPASECPTVEIEGDLTTVTGGCTTEDGTRFEGGATFHNRDALLSEAGEGEVVLEYDDFAVIAGDDEYRFTGEISLDLATSDGSISMRAEHGGIWSHLAADITCDDGGDGQECSFEEGAIVQVQDVGVAALSGHYADGVNNLEGELTLEGAETLVLDLSGTDAEGCVPYSIDGDDAGQICPPTE